jgi:CRP/FNR family transcriptional regulator, transcriptional activator FtrB
VLGGILAAWFNGGMDDAGPTLDLRKAPIFESLPEPALRELLEHAAQVRLGPGAHLFEQGERPTFLHVVLSGSAHLFGRSGGGREVLIDVVEPPELLIPAAVASGLPYLMTARVPEPSRFLLIQANAFRRAVAAEPALALALVKSLSDQFRRMVRHLKSLRLRSASERVGCYLLILARRQGSPNRVTLPLEKRLIASQLGLTRESFSRALSGLKTHGVSVRDDVVEIADGDRLARASGFDPAMDLDVSP